MATTVKIKDLPYITSLQPNTANTVLVGVDVPGDYTGQMTLTTLASGLYSNNRLVVGNYPTVYPNAIGTFANSSTLYVQNLIENTDDAGTSDWIAQSNVSTDTAYFIDVGFTGNTYNNASPYNSLGTSIHQLDGYVYVQGLQGGKGGNLVIGTASANTRVNFIVGGVNSENVVAYMTTSGIYSPSINSLVAANVATLRGEVTSNVNTINGSITANATSANSVINTRITANIATANLFTQAAFDKANNALANTTGTFAGSLSVTQNITTNGYIFVSNTTYNTTKAAFTVTTSNNKTQNSLASGFIAQFSGTYGDAARIVTDSYGANGQISYPAYVGRAARGNVEYPSAVHTDDILLRLGASGYGTTSYQSGGTTRIDFVATENHTDTSRGTTIKFYNVQTGTNTLTNIATFNANDVTFTGTVTPQKGFVYTPNVLNTLASATIDFGRDNLIKFDINNNMTITLQNYVFGKVVEVWITNSSGANKTITHGCMANNSTTKSTTFVIQASACAYLRYFSINGDNSNTFVSIVA